MQNFVCCYGDGWLLLICCCCAVREESAVLSIVIVVNKSYDSMPLSYGKSWKGVFSSLSRCFGCITLIGQLVIAIRTSCVSILSPCFYVLQHRTNRRLTRSILGLVLRLLVLYFVENIAKVASAIRINVIWRRPMEWCVSLANLSYSFRPPRRADWIPFTIQATQISILPTFVSNVSHRDTTKTYRCLIIWHLI